MKTLAYIFAIFVYSQYSLASSIEVPTPSISSLTTLTTTSPLTGGGLLSSGLTIAIPAASASVNGYLSAADFTTFSSNTGMSIGGTVTSGTTGSVLFVGAGPILSQDNANYFWDLTNHRLGLGTTSPAEQLQVTGNIRLPATTSTVGIVKMGTFNWLHSAGDATNFFGGKSAGNLTLTGVRDTGLGSLAGQSLTTATDSTFIGFNAGATIDTGISNTALGSGADFLAGTDAHAVSIGNGATAGDAGTAIGYAARACPGTVAIGFQSGHSGCTGTLNNLFGSSAGGSLTSGAANSMFGHNAGANVTTGSQNAFLGHNSGVFATTGGNNVAFGDAAGFGLTTGADNTLVGRNSGPTLTTGSNNTVIGEGDVSLAAATYQTVIGSGAVGSGNSTVTLGRATDGVVIPDTGGHSGNVVHGRSKQSSTSNTSATCAVTCSGGGELVVGGGCQNSVALNMSDSYPSSDTTWSCVYTLATGNCTAWAICAQY